MVESNQKIICLLSDFGVRGSHYVASMKGIILKINPKVKIIDISHYVSPYSFIEASFILKATYKNFPKGTIFIIVVDPGVGSSREIVVIKTNSNYFFIGPNNGIFPNILDLNKISECIKIQNEQYYNLPVSNTFHGRDIMAPVGAYISKNVVLSKFGTPFKPTDLIELPIEYKINEENKIVQGIIQYIDSFGNGVTNIPIKNNLIKNTNILLNENINIQILIKGNTYEGLFTSHFSRVPIKSLLFLIGSTGFLEISINQGDASKELGFKVGDIIKIKLEEDIC